jgi:hypothetical protein
MNKIMKLVWFAVAALTFSLAPEAHAGATNGAQRGHEVVLPRGTTSYHLKFDVGDQALVSIRGDGSTDLDFYVYDSSGNLVAWDEDATDFTLLAWTPRWTGYFDIKIVNRGNQENLFNMLTN